ncbi:helix-turn-helix transcriptional regulator [Clostridium beijerinckii]|uniref:helix-turn-helix transcriptional regulator n=1 Tax=Clostridium beijerinckii TaxID=1520 RepID=UPI003C12C56A
MDFLQYCVDCSSFTRTGCNLYKSATFRSVFELFTVNYREFLANAIFNDLEDNITNRIRKLRYLSGLSQIEFGKKVNRKVVTVGQWERGIFNPSLPSKKKIIKAFNLPKNYLD